MEPVEKSGAVSNPEGNAGYDLFKPQSADAGDATQTYRPVPSAADAGGATLHENRVAEVTPAPAAAGVTLPPPPPAGLGRNRAAVRRESRPGKRRGRGRLWLLLALLVLIAAGVAAYFLFFKPADTAKTAPTIIPATQAPIVSSVSATGALTAANDLALTFQSAGTVSKIYVKAGDTVKQGDKLADIDPSDLQAAVTQAKANVSSAQAKLDATKVGATAAQIAAAQTQVDTAQANLDKAKNTASTQTPQDIQSAQAAVVSAQAALDAAKRGTYLPQDIQSAQAAVASAQAGLAAAQRGSYLPQDIDNARAAVRSAQANLDAVKKGPYTQLDIQNAQASVTSALANLNAVKNPDPTILINAQAALTQAQQSLDKTKSSLALAVTTAFAARTAAQNTLTQAQQAYQTIYYANRNADGTLKDNLSQTAIDNENNALATATADGQAYAKADQAYNDALTQQTTGVATAQSQVDTAQAAYNKAKAGPLQTDVDKAQASYDQAVIALNKIKAPPLQTDVDKAQAALDQANSTLAKELAGPLDTDIAKAQAALDQANATLAKEQAGPQQSDIDKAQAAYDQAQAALAKLQASDADTTAVNTANSSLKSAVANLQDVQGGPKATDIAQAQATVDDAQSALQTAQLALTKATLTAPFDGTVGAISIIPGQQVTTATATMSVTDTSVLHVDVNVGETDVSKVKLGNAARITFDALPNEYLSGKVTFIAPKSQVISNVVSYVVTITLDQPGTNSIRDLLTNSIGAAGFGGAGGTSASGTPGSGRRGGTAAANGTPGASGTAGASGTPGAGAFPGAGTGTGTRGGAGAAFAAAGNIFGGTVATASEVKPGMTASVTLVTNFKFALAVPSRVIQTITVPNATTGRNQQVQVLDILSDPNNASSPTYRKQIAVGMVGDTYTEITAGISAGDQIAYTPTAATRSTSTSAFPGAPAGAGGGGRGGG